MIAEQKIASMGIELPAMSEPKAMYVPVVQTGNLCFVSGQIPMVGDSLVSPEKLAIHGHWKRHSPLLRYV